MRISDWSSDVCSSDLLAIIARQLASDEIGSLYAVRAFINGRDPRIAIMLRCAGFFDEAHAAMHLNAQRGDLASHIGSIGLGKRRQQIGRASCRERVCQYV